MNCENIKEKLSLYIDGLLDASEAEIVKEHIENCDSCRAYYNKLLKLGEMVDDFVISKNEEYWVSQKDKVLDKIEQDERNKPEKIIDIQPVRKQNKFYKYLAVAASLALVAFVSIYESQEFSQVKGLFDDSDVEEVKSVPVVQSAPEPPIKKMSVDDISTKGRQVDEVVEKKENVIIIKAPAKPKKRTTKSQTVPKQDKKDIAREGVGAEQVEPAPEPMIIETSLDLGKGEVINREDRVEGVLQSLEFSPPTVGIEAISIETPRVESKKDKELSPEEMQKRFIERQGKSDSDFGESAFSFESVSGMDNMTQPSQDPDSTISKINIYKIKLDSLEKKYEGIYSPHYIESSAKSRKGIHSDSLDAIVLKLSEACFQVGILSLEENEREEMISKLRQLSIHGSPEAIEKIQRYIVILLSAE